MRIGLNSIAPLLWAGRRPRLRRRFLAVNSQSSAGRSGGWVPAGTPRSAGNARLAITNWADITAPRRGRFVAPAELTEEKPP
jgi:hypothetical protein